MRVRRPRKSIVALAGDVRAGETHAKALESLLAELGAETTYLGHVQDACHIVNSVREQDADAVEICMGPAGGIVLLRDLLRRLTEAGRRDVSIVVHRVP
jgi:methylmalonyl-CoA mutase cobalamin-binding subunit